MSEETIITAAPKSLRRREAAVVAGQDAIRAAMERAFTESKSLSLSQLAASVRRTVPCTIRAADKDTGVSLRKVETFLGEADRCAPSDEALSRAIAMAAIAGSGSVKTERTDKVAESATLAGSSDRDRAGIARSFMSGLADDDSALSFIIEAAVTVDQAKTAKLS